MLPFYINTSTTSAYWIQTNSISINVAYNMIFYECVAICTLVIISTANGFYLPGLAPVNYCKEKDVTGTGAKSCKVMWSHYIFYFWCTWRGGIFVTNNWWVRWRKTTILMIRIWASRHRRYAFAFICQRGFDDFQVFLASFFTLSIITVIAM